MLEELENRIAPTSGVGALSGIPLSVVQPGGTVEQAAELGIISSGSAIRLNQEVGDSSGSSEVDWYSFDLLQETNVVIESLGLDDGFDGVLSLYHMEPFAPHRTIRFAFSSDQAESVDPKIDLDLLPGRYFIALSGEGNYFYDIATAGSGSPGSTGEYELSIIGNSPLGASSGPQGGLSGPEQSFQIEGNTAQNVQIEVSFAGKFDFAFRGTGDDTGRPLVLSLSELPGLTIDSVAGAFARRIDLEPGIYTLQVTTDGPPAFFEMEITPVSFAGPIPPEYSPGQAVRLAPLKAMTITAQPSLNRTLSANSQGNSTQVSLTTSTLGNRSVVGGLTRAVLRGNTNLTETHALGRHEVIRLQPALYIRLDSAVTRSPGIVSVERQLVDTIPAQTDLNLDKSFESFPFLQEISNTVNTLFHLGQDWGTAILKAWESLPSGEQDRMESETLVPVSQPTVCDLSQDEVVALAAAESSVSGEEQDESAFVQDEIFGQLPDSLIAVLSLGLGGLTVRLMARDSHPSAGQREED